MVTSLIAQSMFGFDPWTVDRSVSSITVIILDQLSTTLTMIGYSPAPAYLLLIPNH